MWVRRFVQLGVGVFLYGIAIAMMVRAGVGVAPWDVLTQGLARTTGLAFGLLTIIVGAIVLALWIPIKQKPGIGTVVNIVFVGLSAEVGFALIPVLDTASLGSLWIRIPLFAAGLVVLAIATGLYVGARLGPGPRDGLMTGLVARTGWPVWIVRTGIEVVVVAVGWLLGGNVGIGTIAFAVLIGPLIGIFLPRMRVPEPEGGAAVASADPRLASAASSAAELATEAAVEQAAAGTARPSTNPA
ncbi:hypothetical protein FJ658_03145 [Schumannella sp. 10F1B-5-1]|nr:hypothetical protein FJ658_03145 [Schumannella sp. 10F1B-5-1]